MGFFSKFGGQKDYPALGSDNTAARQLANMQAALKTLVEEIPDKLEVVPSDDAAYVFIGKPPKRFGMAWIDEDGQIGKLHTLVKDKGVQPSVLQGISEELRVAYEKNQDADRFTAEVGGKSIIVTPCPELKDEVAEIINRVAN